MKSSTFYLGFKFLFFFIGITVLDLEAQTMVAVPTPNAANLGTFGQIPVSQFTGVPNIGLPLYTLQQDGVELPITLQYHTSLNKPDVQPGWTGQGWSLAAGGSITRIVKGKNLYDENLNGNNYSYLDQHFHIAGSDWASYANLNALVTSPSGQNIDFEPDEFTFNFGKYSGSFYMNHNGNWVVQSQSPVQIDIKSTLSSGSFVFGTFSVPRYFISFSLTTEDGVKYIFGNDPVESPGVSGDPVAMEFSADLTSIKDAGGNETANFANSLIPTTWHLTKIKLPNGKIFSLTYTRGGGVYNVERGYMSTKEWVDITTIPCDFKQMFITLVLFGGFANCDWGSLSTNSYYNGFRINLLYPSYLNKIALSDGTNINFINTTAKQWDFTDLYISQIKVTNVGPSRSTWKKLDEITVYNQNGELVKDYKLFYNNNQDQRLILDYMQEVSTNNEVKKYDFNYNATSLPFYNSGQIDHWGYYTGKASYFTNAEILLPDYFYTQRNVTASNLEATKAGILTEIIYPTGGRTEFEYELNECSSYLSKEDGAVYSQLNDIGQNSYAGGLRIKKITSKGITQEIISEKEYKYVKNYASGGSLSSGVLAGIPQYFQRYASTRSTVVAFRDIIVEPLSYTNGSHITYSEVVEIENGNGYRIFKYSNSGTDNYTDAHAFYTGVTIDGINTTIESYAERYLPFNSRAYTRGLLTDEYSYSQAGTLQHRKTYAYNTALPSANGEDFVRALNITLALQQSGGNIFAVSAYGNYTYTPYLNSVVTYDYDPSGLNPIMTSNFYSYNNKLQLSKEEFDRSDNKKIFTEYKYPTDIEDAKKTPAITSLVDGHILNGVIEKMTYQVDATTNKVIDAEYNDYNIFYADATKHIIKPQTIYKLNSAIPLDLNGFEIRSVVQPQITSQQAFYLEYDPGNGNPPAKNFTVSANSGETTIANIQINATIYNYNSAPSVYLECGTLVVTITGPVNKTYSSASLPGTIYNPDQRIVNFNENVVLPNGSYTFQLSYISNSLNSPCGLTFGSSSLNVNTQSGSGPTIVLNSALQRQAIFNYNDTGNTTDIRKANDFNTTYLWGYNYSVPIARIENAYSSEVATALGTTSITTLQTLNDDALKSALNVLRTQLPNARVTTYIYDPLVGITSITDPNNITSYYTYDTFGRLESIKDANGNIQKTYTYHFKQ